MIVKQGAISILNMKGKIVNMFIRRNKKTIMLVVCLALFLPVQPPLTVKAQSVSQNSITDISVGGGSMLYVTAENCLWGWGDNYYGQLGDGTASPKDAPVKIMDNVKTVSTSGTFTLAVKTDGSLWTWGNNDGFLLGDGTYAASRVPIEIMDDVAMASAGTYHSAAVKTDGSLWVWGDAFTLDASAVEEPIKVMDGVKYAAAGDVYTMAIKNDGSLWGFGWNSTFNQGIGDTYGFIGTPIKVMDDVGSVTACAYTTAVKKDGSLWTWGVNDSDRNQTADAPGYGSIVPRPGTEKIMDNVLSAAGIGYYKLALKNDGNLYGWGDIDYSYLLNGDSSTYDSTTSDSPKLMLSDVTMASSSDYRAMAVTKDGKLWTWGVNGDGTVTTDPAPVSMPDQYDKPIWGDLPVTLPEGEWNDGTPVIKVSAGAAVLALKADGSVWAWGQNDNGQVGDGTAKDRSTPVKILDGAIDVQTHSSISEALMKDGRVLVWGAAENEAGVLGDGAGVGSRIPTYLTDNATNISVNCLIIKQDNSLWGWNQYADKSVSYEPLQKIHKITDGITGAFTDGGDIRQADNSLMEVVWNSGDDSSQDQVSFNPLDSDIIYQAYGGGSLLQIHKDGTLWAKGADDSAYGNSEDTNGQVVKILDNVKKVAGGSYHALALLNDGSVWAWGLNSAGQIGAGSDESGEFGRHDWAPGDLIYGDPVKIMDGVSDIFAGGETSYAIKDDGSLWAWGANGDGQLGDGTTNDALTPVKINDGKADS